MGIGTIGGTVEGGQNGQYPPNQLGAQPLET